MAATAAELWQQDGDDARLVRALVTLSRQQWLTERTAAARASAERAFELARPLGDSYQNALATLNLGGLLVRNDQEPDGLPYLDEALAMAGRCGADSVAALCRNTGARRSSSSVTSAGRDDLQRSMAQAIELGNHEYVMRAYYNPSRAWGCSANTARPSAISSRRRTSAATGTSASTGTCSPRAGACWR